MSRHHSRRLVILKHVGDMKQAAHMTFYSCSGRETLYIPVSSIVGALQSTDALMLNAQCSCRGVPAVSVVSAKQSLWYVEITIG